MQHYATGVGAPARVKLEPAAASLQARDSAKAGKPAASSFKRRL